MNDSQTWQEFRLNPGGLDDLWELFHENSKVGRHDSFPPQSYLREKMEKYWTSLPYRNYPAVALPASRTELTLSLSEAIMTRVSGRTMERAPISLDSIATLLRHAYGITRLNKDTIYPRPFRVVPSGGALYPLELYIHSNACHDIETGVYHYNPTDNELRLLRKGDATREISGALIQPNIVHESSLMIFITAIFERSTFKYGARGYRFACIEAGHVAQNVNLVANALGLACLNIGGFLDRELDELLELDGLRHGVIYAIGVGKKASGDPEQFVDA